MDGGTADSALIRAEIVDGGRGLHLAWADGLERRCHAAWLRDNSPAPDNSDPRTGQRFFDIARLEGEILLRRARLTEDGHLEVLLAPDGHSTRFTADWLRRGYRTAPRHQPRLWGSEAGGQLPSAALPRLQADRRALYDWLVGLADWGVARLTEVPCAPGAGEAVIRLFGYVRETNYGRVFDVVSQLNPNNLAFTGLALGLHSDNPYREPVPGLQLLHCLSSDAEGGESLLRDGFQAAETLRRRSPEHFALLTSHEVPFRFADAETELVARARLIETDSKGSLRAVRYNNRSAAAFDLPYEIMGPYYDAYRAFGRLLQDPAEQVSFRMVPGEAFIVDNHRVLHGRGAFSGSGRRHLQGWYADKDHLLSRIAVLERELKG